MKIVATIIASLLLVLAGCESTPIKDAPVTDVNLGTKPPPGPGSALPPLPQIPKPPAVDLTVKPPGADGIDPAVKQGVLAQRSVLFDYDRDEIREQFRPLLQAHAGYLSKTTNAKMLIQGNTDERGSREYNLALGQRRAEAIKRMLILMGAKDAQIEATSLGEEKPRRTGHGEDDYAENRRGDLLYGGEF